jgi:intracellular sulfur oxidation DsrE/DsrF family protein
MRLFRYIILAIITLSSTTFALAQETVHTEGYIVLTKNVQQIKPIILAAQQLIEKDQGNPNVFEIIICGKAVNDLQNDSIIQPLIEFATKNNVTILACGFSLQKFKIDSTKIPKKIGIVENGILYNFQRQKQGTLSIEL